MRPTLPQQCVDVLEQRDRARSPLSEHLTVVDERTRRTIRRRIECQRQHSSIETILLAPVVWRSRTANRGGGSTPVARLGPLHERDRPVEVRLEIAPLGR